MLKLIKFRVALRKLQRQRTRLHRLYDVDIQAARKAGQPTEPIVGMLFAERVEFDDGIASLQTQYLLRQAEYRFIPVPEYEGVDDANWVRSSYDGRRHLTLTALDKLRADIRKERRERLDDLRLWLPTTISLLSLVVAIVALAAKY